VLRDDDAIDAAADTTCGKLKKLRKMMGDVSTPAAALSSKRVSIFH